MRFRALFTRHVRQKHKTFHDGFLTLDVDARIATLTDEFGSRLASAAVRAEGPGDGGAWPPEPDAELLPWFDGFLVSLDGLDDGSGGDGGVPAAQLAPPPPLTTRLAATLPRSALAPRPPTQPAPHAGQPPSQPSASQRQRTDDEIMGVLLGTCPALPPPPVPTKRVRREGGREGVHGGQMAAGPAQHHHHPPATAAGRWAVPRRAAASGGGDAVDRLHTLHRAGPAPASTSLRPGCADLAFPGPAAAAHPPRRHAAIADAFPGPGPYLAALRAAVVEDLDLRLHAVAARFHAARARVVGAAPPAGGAAAQQQPPTHTAVARAARLAGLAFFPDSTLQVFGGGGERDGFTGGGGDRDGFTGGGSGSNRNRRPSFFLDLAGSGGPPPPSSTFHKDDLWVVASSPDLASTSGPGTDRLAAPWVGVARSVWHGPNRDGRIEVAWVAGRPPGGGGGRLRRTQPAAALHAGEASSELAALAAFDGDMASPGVAPVIWAVSGGAAPPVTGLPAPPPTGPACSAAATAASAARLNPHQTSVLTTVAGWFDERDAALTAGQPPPPPRICVVHGPFGSGKSATLTALVRLLAGGTGTGGGLGARVLVAAHTNAAVDRVLTRLVEEAGGGGGAGDGGGGEEGGGEEEAAAAAAAPSPSTAAPGPDLIRVGPLRRMDRRLLPWSLHAPGATKGDATAELEALLRGAAGRPAEAADLRAELARVRAGAVARRRRRLGSVAVIGATCASSAALAIAPPTGQGGGGGGGGRGGGRGADTADTLSTTPFPPVDVVILDEAGQIREPDALLTLLAVRPRVGIVIAGDPAQLPPVVGGPAAVTPPPPRGGGGGVLQEQQQRPPPTTTATALHGLARSLLSRLLAAGHAPLLLGVQYRCHPAIAGIANRLFYGGRLSDGVGPADRPPLVPGLPPVSVLDVAGGSVSYDAGRSAFNTTEAGAAAAGVAAVLAHGLDPGRVGVIAPFRAHARAVTAALAAADPLDRPGRAGGDDDGDGAAPPLALPSSVVVATVDAFQGEERDVIFLSACCSGGGGGFAGDAARLCVAFTRARHHLVLVGSVRGLGGVPGFREVVAAARACGGVRASL